MAEIFDTVLLLASPAAGKSEVRRYLATLKSKDCARDYHVGPMVMLDESPYLRIMRQVDDALLSVDKPPVFFQSPEKPFIESRDFGTLIHLLNQDYADMVAKRVVEPDSAADHLLDRIDNARKRVGAQAVLSSLDEDSRVHVCSSIEDEAATILAARQKAIPASLEGHTVFIELARGGPQGSKMPLMPPLGYAYSLAQLDPEILERAVVVYISVPPEQCRRRNEARSKPNEPGSILYPRVPHDVMVSDYGTDDIGFLLEQAGAPNTLRIKAHGKNFHLPCATFDNRLDRTAFVRGPQKSWKAAQVKELQAALTTVFGQLYAEIIG